MLEISPKRIRFMRNEILVGILVIIILLNIAFVIRGWPSLLDYGSFIASGQLANAGENPYSDQSPLIFSIQFGENGPGGSAPNLNPPISVLLFQGLAEINPEVSIVIWRITSIILYVSAVIILHQHHPIHGFPAVLRVGWALSMAGFWHCIELGQIYTLLLMLVVATWVFIKQGKFLAAGIFLGTLIAIKPNLILWAIFLWLGSYGKVFWISSFAAAIISIFPLAKYGVGIYQQWLDASVKFTPHLLLFPGNNSFQGLTARLGSSNSGIILGIILVVVVVIFILKKKPDTATVNALGMVSSMLVSPIAWTGYTLLLIPIFFSQEKWNWKYLISGAIFTVPFAIPLKYFMASFGSFIFWGWFYGWGLLILVSATLLSSRRTDQTPAITSSIHTN
jgi:hypothetical protein